MLDAIQLTLAPASLFFVLLGVTAGIVVGAVPGLTGTMLIALTLPLTFYMDSVNALMLLVAMYVGAISGGLISATLLRMPGTPASVMTTFDGYPMAQQGNPGRALALGIAASFAGGIISWMFLVLLAAPLAAFAVRFTPWDYFALTLMALVLISTVSQGSMYKGFLAGFLGIMVSLPGNDPSSGTSRLTFGIYDLENGFALLPILVGMFAVSKVLGDILEIGRRPTLTALPKTGFLLDRAGWIRNAGNMVRSSIIGTWIGMLPGVGANIGSVVSYATARNLSKTPERFGKGSEEGIVAAEAGNNGTVGGALIPLVSLGIPGSVIDAILIGGLILHGIQPGPMLFSTNPEIVYAIIVACLIANVMMFVIMSGAVRYIAQLVFIDRAILLPLILVFCVIGSYAYANRMYDVWVMLGFAVLGLFMERAKIPLGPFVIGFVLAPICEAQLRSGLMLSGGSYSPLFTQPISLTFVLISALTLTWPLVSSWRRRRQQDASAGT